MNKFVKVLVSAGSFGVALIGLLVMTGYFLGASWTVRWMGFTPMAFSTALCFFVLGLCVFGLACCNHK